MAIKPNIQKSCQHAGPVYNSEPAPQPIYFKSLFSWHNALVYLDVTAGDPCWAKPFFLLEYGRLICFHLKTKYWGFYHPLPPALVLSAPFPHSMIPVGSCACMGSCALLMGETSRRSHPWPAKSHAPSTVQWPTRQQGDEIEIQMVCPFHCCESILNFFSFSSSVTFKMKCFIF